MLRSKVFWCLVQFCSYPHRWRIHPLEFLSCAALHDQQPSLIYTLIRLQEPTHPAVIKLHMLRFSPAHMGTALGTASASPVCWIQLIPSSVSIASSILAKTNAICSCVCCKSSARNKEKFKYLRWVVTLSIQAINDRLQQSLLVPSAGFPPYRLQLRNPTKMKYLQLTVEF